MKIPVKIEELILDVGEHETEEKRIDVDKLPDNGVVNLDIQDYLEDYEDIQDDRIIMGIVNNIISDYVSDMTGYMVASLTYSLVK